MQKIKKISQVNFSQNFKTLFWALLAQKTQNKIFPKKKSFGTILRIYLVVTSCKKPRNKTQRVFLNLKNLILGVFWGHLGTNPKQDFFSKHPALSIKLDETLTSCEKSESFYEWL